MEELLDYKRQSVRLTGERWNHIVEHAEMVEMRESVRETLAHPALVTRSLTDETVLLNYQYYKNTLVGDKWLCVAVKYSVSDAFVLTAYLTDKPKRGEVVWQKR